MVYKDIIKLVPTLQSVSLLSHNVGYLTDKKKKGKIVKQGFENLISLPLIQSTAQMTDF